MWQEWVGKIVFIKLEDGQIFSFSKVLAYEEPFMSITDRDGFPVVFRVSQILSIKEELKIRGEREDAY
jgi:hypothetical protein